MPSHSIITLLSPTGCAVIVLRRMPISCRPVAQSTNCIVISARSPVHLPANHLIDQHLWAGSSACTQIQHWRNGRRRRGRQRRQRRARREDAPRIITQMFFPVHEGHESSDPAPVSPEGTRRWHRSLPQAINFRIFSGVRPGTQDR